MKIIKNFQKLEKSDRIIFFLIFTTLGNTIMAIFKLAYSFSLPSLWFFVNGIFNTILAFLRIFSIRDYSRRRLEKDKKIKEEIERKNYLNNGILLIVLGIAYFFVSVYMYYNNANIKMTDFTTYLVALFAFYSISSATYGMSKYRKDKSPIISSVKITNFANALTSIVLTQVVLLNNFGNTDVRVANGYMGMAVSIVIMILGVYMIINMKKYIEE